MSYIYSKTDLSQTAGSDPSNFYGATERAVVACGDHGVHEFVDDVFHGCGNALHIHYKPAPEVYGRCAFQYDKTGGQIEVYLGFDAARVNVCDGTAIIGQFYEFDPCAGITCPVPANLCT